MARLLQQSYSNVIEPAASDIIASGREIGAMNIQIEIV